MNALAVRDWPSLMYRALILAAALLPGQAFAQFAGDSFEAPLPSATNEADWPLAWSLPSAAHEPVRLADWADWVAPGIPKTDTIPNAGDLTWFAQSQSSTSAGEEELAPELSGGLEELRTDRAGRRQRTVGDVKRFGGRLMSDQLQFYSPESLLMLGGGLAVGGIMANSAIDRNVQRHLQSSLHHANTDEWLESLHANKELGDGTLTLPIFAGAWLVGSVLPESRSSEVARTWGENSLRGFLVGAPPLLLLQLATGGSRPGEAAHGSQWQPFHDDNGVSGHSFMGALPFITAAKMSDSMGWKTALYAASTLAPLSRAADGAHYPSQIALGWWMAFLSASAVHATGHPNDRWRIYPTTVGTGSGMALEYRF